MKFSVQVINETGEPLYCAQYDKGTRVLLSDVLRQAGLHQDHPCGGRGRCGKCLIRATGILSPMSEEERAHLSHAPNEGYRLACTTYALGSSTVYYTTEQPKMQGVTQGFSADFSRFSASVQGGRGTGLAVDIGTTTVACYLYALATGEQLGALCRTNPQREHGADVISRVDFAIHGGLSTLQEEIVSCVDQMTQQLCTMTHMPAPNVRVITGNTAMLHFFTATDASPLAAAPFAIRRFFGESVEQRSVKTYFPRCISAFIGADITAALLASGLCEDNKTALLLDIGTNGEMALLHQGKLLCCSTAAGPALEGAGISCGAMAVDGAIDRVTVQNGSLLVHQIGERQDMPPIGLCGTGLIDAVAALLTTGELEDSGYLEQDAMIGTCRLTQQDIRQVQLAKAAIRAGLETLLHTANIGYDDIEEVALAGGFGSYLHPESCAVIGLIPAALVGKIRVLGNAAGSGASMMLLCDRERERAEQIATMAKVVDLSTNATFRQRYVEEMYFEGES